MARILVLGGTAWLGREVARQALARGHDVTCLARGDSGEPPSGVQFVSGDRSRPDAYDAVRGTVWDQVVDVSWQPAFVAGALAALAADTAHWCYVSSVSVYARNDEVGADEAAATLVPLMEAVAGIEHYGEAKVRCEDLVMEAMGDRALLARAGLIVGPGDPSDRFGYWVGRFALAGDGPVLIPDPGDAPAQVIDLRDLAAWLLHGGETRTTGAVNAVGSRISLGRALGMAAAVAGFAGRLVPASSSWLIDHGVEPWAGPNSLPLWLPDPGDSAMMARSDARAVDSGMTRRPLVATLRDVLDDEVARGLDRDRRAGLTRAEELALISARESVMS